MSEINEDMKPYKGKGDVLYEVFEADSLETLIDKIETAIVVNPIFALGQIRLAMQNYSTGRVEACLKEGRII